MSTALQNKNGRFDIAAKILVFAYSFLFIMYNTLPGGVLEVWEERFECVVGAGLVVITIIKFSALAVAEKKRWLTAQSLVFLYFAVRLLCLIGNGFDYSTIRSIFFEGVYLLALTVLTVDGSFVKRAVCPLIAVINLIFNALNVLFWFYMEHIAEATPLYVWLQNNTFYAKHGATFSTMYVNPNTFGIMTAFSIIIVICLCRRGMSSAAKAGTAVYMAFSFMCLMLSQCRSAQAGLIAALAAMLITVVIKPLTPKNTVTGFLILSIFLTGAMTGFIHSNLDTGIESEYGVNRYSADERALDSITTVRYTIWKDGYVASHDYRWLGSGSQKTELASRNETKKEAFEAAGGDAAEYEPTKLSTHNGYIGMMYVTGILGFVAFMAVLFVRIRKSRAFDTGLWYMPLVFILTVNHFECMMIISKFFTCLFMFLILTVDSTRENIGDKAMGNYLSGLKGWY